MPGRRRARTAAPRSPATPPPRAPAASRARAPRPAAPSRGLTNGTSYSFTVTATNAVGAGGASNSLSATPATIPGAPALTSAVAGPNAVTLTWTPSSTGGPPITGYTASSSPGGFTCSSNGALSCTVTGLTAGTSYSFTVAATNALGTSGPSNALSATPLPAPTAPGAPNLTGAAAGDDSVSLTWTTPTDGGSAITGYKVYRGTSTGTETLLTIVGAVNGYADHTAVNGTTYFYVVRAANGVGDGLPSNERSAMPVSMPAAPTLTAAVPGNSVTLTWSPPTDTGGMPITGYNVYRSTVSGQETLLTSVGVVTTYADETTNDGITYYYVVTALNAVGESARSNEMSAMPVAPPADTTAPSKPGTLRTLVSGTSQLIFDWPDSTDNVGVTGYKVYRDGALIDTVTTSYYFDSGLPSGTSHVYQVRARDAAGNESLPSSNLKAKIASRSRSTTTGSLSGVVLNELGKPLASAVVRVTLSNGAIKSTTTNAGVWKLTSLPLGPCTLTISLLGYQTASLDATVAGGQTLLAVTTLTP